MKYSILQGNLPPIMTKACKTRSTVSTHACRNCENTITGNFRNLYGQRADTQRLDTAAIAHDLLQSVI